MTIRIIKGDVREKLAEFPADYFDCIVTSPPYFGLRSYLPDGHPLKHFEIGLEPTLDAYLETIVAVCRELRRVLKTSGVCFINIGDSYAANRSYQISQTKHKSHDFGSSNAIQCPDGLKPKDLCLVPERLGIALQADGWWVRSKIIWHKLNPMPESCTDRPTSAHETIWMLTKSARYFWDAEAVKENSVADDISEFRGGAQRNLDGSKANSGRSSQKASSTLRELTRNLRNVWSFASHPYPGAHFATFPPELAERCIKAGSSERGRCPSCGAPWVRVVETKRVEHSHSTGKENRAGVHGSETSSSSVFRTNLVPITKTIGWQPSCKCSADRGLSTGVDMEPIPARILDPFAGAGTTGLVADRLGRDCTLIDLNTEYAEMALNRIKDDCPMFAEVAAE